MVRVVLALCAAEVLGMTGTFAFPALLPAFSAEWGLSNTEAGWISGVYFAGYAAAVPVLTALTDRLDAKRVWLAGMVITVLATAGFALMADGFRSAMVLRALGGIGLAGTYMPGLKALVDRTSGPRQPRWMSWYTASFSLGTSSSFLIAGVMAELWGWRAAYGVAAMLAAAGLLVVGWALKPSSPPPVVAPTALLDFRPVLRNRPVMGYILGYAAHVWELFGLRSWMVAFLVAVAGSRTGVPSPTVVATLAALVAMAASIGGAELAVRFDRRRFCAAAAILSAITAAGLGFTLHWPYAAVAALVLLYNAFVQLDSAALTTGAMLEAEASRRGTTVALHSLLGFAAGFAGPLAFGWVLDVAGGSHSDLAWRLAFLSLAVVAGVGPLALRWSRR